MAVRTLRYPAGLSDIYARLADLPLHEVLQVAIDRRAQYSGEPLSVGALSTAAGLPATRVAAAISGSRLPSHDELNLLAMAMGLGPDDRKFLQAVRQKTVVANDVGEVEAGETNPHLPLASQRRRLRSVPDIPLVPKSGQPDPLLVSTTKELIQALNEVREWAGNPSLRELEQRTAGRLRRSTVSEMLRREALPKYEQLVNFLTACTIERPHLDYWVFAWRRLKAQERSSPV